MNMCIIKNDKADTEMTFQRFPGLNNKNIVQNLNTINDRNKETFGEDVRDKETYDDNREHNICKKNYQMYLEKCVPFDPSLDRCTNWKGANCDEQMKRLFGIDVPGAGDEISGDEISGDEISGDEISGSEEIIQSGVPGGSIGIEENPEYPIRSGNCESGECNKNMFTWIISGIVLCIVAIISIFFLFYKKQKTKTNKMVENMVIPIKKKIIEKSEKAYDSSPTHSTYDSHQPFTTHAKIEKKEDKIEDEQKTEHEPEEKQLKPLDMVKMTLKEPADETNVEKAFRTGKPYQIPIPSLDDMKKYRPDFNSRSSTIDNPQAQQLPKEEQDTRSFTIDPPQNKEQRERDERKRKYIEEQGKQLKQEKKREQEKNFADNLDSYKALAKQEPEPEPEQVPYLIPDFTDAKIAQNQQRIKESQVKSLEKKPDEQIWENFNEPEPEPEPEPVPDVPTLLPGSVDAAQNKHAKMLPGFNNAEIAQKGSVDYFFKNVF